MEFNSGFKGLIRKMRGAVEVKNRKIVNPGCTWGRDTSMTFGSLHQRYEMLRFGRCRTYQISTFRTAGTANDVTVNSKTYNITRMCLKAMSLNILYGNWYIFFNKTKTGNFLEIYWSPLCTFFLHIITSRPKQFLQTPSYFISPSP